MNLNKLARQLRREAMANPKKAAVLGLLLLVALYFWGPLVWGRVAGDGASEKPPAAEANGEDNPQTSAQIPATQPQPPSPEKTRHSSCL